MAIDFSLSEAQKLIQSTAHDFFERKCPTKVVRELEASERGYSPEMWQQMAELGWLGITYPEKYGGSGGTFLDMYPLYEEIGRFLVPSPHLDTVVIAGETILEAGNDAQKEQLLPPITKGELIISPAIMEPNGTFGPAGITLSAVARGEDHLLNGTKLLVPYAPSADQFLCVARTGGNGSAHGVSLFLVAARAAGIFCEPLENLAGGALYEVTFTDVIVPASSLVGSLNDGWGPLSSVMTKAAVLQSAAIVGAAQRVLEMTTDHAKDRVQFGNPIGKYQAVQYMVTDVLIDMHRAQLLTKQAAYRIDAGKTYAREAAIANAFAKQAAAHLHRQAHEVHAGVAFILEHDLTLFSRRAKYWEYNLGDARYHQEQLAHEMSL